MLGVLRMEPARWRQATPHFRLVPRALGEQRQQGRGRHVLEVAADREAHLFAPDAAPCDLGPAVHLARLEQAADQQRRIAQQLAFRTGEGAPMQFAAQAVLELHPLAQHEEVAQHQRRRVPLDHLSQPRDRARHQVVVGVEEPHVLAAGLLQHGVACTGESLVLPVEKTPHAHRAVGVPRPACARARRTRRWSSRPPSAPRRRHPPAKGRSPGTRAGSP